MEALRNAKAIVLKLAEAGYTAYFAGGWVRDFVMGHPSEDIDIATNAPPAKIMEIFPNTNPVGVAFGIVIVIYFIATFCFACFESTFSLLVKESYRFAPEAAAYLFTFCGLVAAFIQGGLIGRFY